MTLPRDVQFHEDDRLFVWRPRGVLDDAALGNVLGYTDFDSTGTRLTGANKYTVTFPKG